MPIRVLIVDDSPIIRSGLRMLLEEQEDMTVVGEGETGEQAIEMAQALEPSIITMDVNMPGKSGLEAIEEIMAYHPTPILVLTSCSSFQGEENLTFRALELGALDLMEKLDLQQMGEALLEKLRLLSKVKVISHVKGRKKKHPSDRLPIPPRSATSNAWDRIVIIGASAGGPTALRTIFQSLPADYPFPILVAQHLPSGFSLGLTSWLQESSQLKLRAVETGDILRPGTIMLAPAGHHVVFEPHGKLKLIDSAPHDLYSPSIDLVMESAAQVFGNRTIGVILTGMGRDGAQGMLKIQEAGGFTIAEDESTCLVFGMPQRAIELNAIQEVLPRHKISRRLKDLIPQ